MPHRTKNKWNFRIIMISGPTQKTDVSPLALNPGAAPAASPAPTGCRQTWRGKSEPVKQHCPCQQLVAQAKYNAQASICIIIVDTYRLVIKSYLTRNVRSSNIRSL